MTTSDRELSRCDVGRSDEVKSSFEPEQGIDRGVVEQISQWKAEPRWVTRMRLRSLGLLETTRMTELPDIALHDIAFHDIDLHDTALHDIDLHRRPSGQRRYRAGVAGEDDAVDHERRKDLEARGIRFCDLDAALREYPHLVEEHFGTVIAPGDDGFAALNTSVWSGGTFVYVPPGVECEMPLEAFSRINPERAGQFERTLIIADEGAQVHYIEGCPAPVYTSRSLHSAVVEIIVKPNARVTYTTIQNWSPNVDNLVAKRARVEAGGHVEWIDGNIGSKLIVKQPSVHLVGEGATARVLSVCYAGEGQHQQSGARMVHAAPNTSSTIVSKSISKDGGISTSRGLVKVDEGAHGCTGHVQCDALVLDEDSVSEAVPDLEIGELDAEIGHAATVSKIADEQLFYLTSRGLSEAQAMGMVVNGFIEPITRALPMEYAVEWSRLIELQMEGSVG